MGGGGVVRVDVNEELKFLVKIQKKKNGGGGSGGGGGGSVAEGVSWGGWGLVGAGVRVDRERNVGGRG